MKKVACPMCREEGRDSGGDHMALFAEGNGYCHAGHGHIPKHVIEGGSMPVPKTSKTSVATVQGYPFGTDPVRKIPKETCEAYGVRYEANFETGEPYQVYYPQHPFESTDDKSVHGYKVRRLPRDWRPSVGKKPEQLWGKQNCKVSGRFLIIVEGEEDVLATSEIMAQAPAQTVDIVSLPNGASVSKVVTDDIKFLEQYKRIYIALDNDKPGQKCADELADFISSFTEVRLVELDPAIGKDASDYWTGGHYRQFRKAIKDAQVYQPEGVVNGVDIDLDDLLEPLPEGAKIPFKGIQNKLHGVRKGEILTVCAGSGIGKSTVVREIAKSLIEDGHSVANVALEDQMNVAAQALIALGMNMPLHDIRFNPPPKAKMKPIYEALIANGRTYFFKHFGGLTADTLMNKMYYYAKTKAVDYIILDHLSMVISATNTNNERKDIDTLMTNLAKMVVETGVGLIQIVHLKRSGGDKSFAKGGEVELTDLRGSAALEQLSWGVLALERDQQAEDPNTMKARVLKNRTYGFTGLADTLEYNPVTGRTTSIL